MGLCDSGDKDKAVVDCMKDILIIL